MTRLSFKVGGSFERASFRGPASLPDYRSCGKHGTYEGSWQKKIDLNCADCFSPSLRRKDDGEYVGDLRAWAGVEREVTEVAVGEQLTLSVVS